MLRHTNQHYFAGALVALMLLLALPCLAQDDPIELDRFRMLLYSGLHMEGSNGLLTATEFTGTNKDGDEIRLARNEIKLLDVAGASKTGQYAVIGALSGLATAGIAILNVQADPNYELDSSRVVPVTAVLVGIGALVGAGFGANAREWNNLPLTPSVGLFHNHSGISYTMAISF